MKLTNAIKKLSKTTVVEKSGNRYSADMGNHVITFLAKGRVNENTTITNIFVRRKDANDASLGELVDNLSQAIHLAKRSTTT